jgi:hypothetical protein
MNDTTAIGRDVFIIISAKKFLVHNNDWSIFKPAGTEDGSGGNLSSGIKPIASNERTQFPWVVNS